MEIQKTGLNTYYTEVEGKITYEDEMTDSFICEACTVGIAVSADETEMLTLSVDNAQLSAPFDKVMEVVEEARKHNICRS